ncbi:MAG: ATP-binding protein [Flavobacteriales bacterium]
MELKRVKIKNFRCFKEETSIEIDDLNCFIGVNDVGKSTILEALDAFFNEKIERDDLSKNADNNQIEITCVFDDVPKKMILDSEVETSLEEEGILNSEGLLEILRVFKYNGKQQKEYYINCMHPNHEDLKNILSLSNSKLKEIVRKQNIDTTRVRETVNSELRKVIRDFYQSGREEQQIKVEGSINDNRKNIWEKIKKEIPVFSLFNVDRDLNDEDKDVQDPMRTAVREVIEQKSIQDKLRDIENEIKEKSSEVAQRTIDKLKNIDSRNSEGLKSDFSRDPNYERNFNLTLLNDEGIPLNKRGSGVRRLVLLSFFQAKAEEARNSQGAPAIIYGIEEPETSQHPEHQIMLINSLVELSMNDNIQVLFTTHNANLAREIPPGSFTYIKESNVDRLVYYAVDENGQFQEEVINEVIETLDVLPDPRDKVNLLVFLEGNNDINALMRYSSILAEYDDDILDLSNRDDIGYVLTGGSSLKHYVDRGLLENLNKPQIHIYDNDDPQYKERIGEINDTENEDKKGFLTPDLEMENFLDKEAVKEAFQEYEGIELNIVDLNGFKVPEYIAKERNKINGVHSWDNFSEKKKEKKIDQVKKSLSTIAVEKMSKQRIDAAPGSNELKRWLREISSYCS